MSDAESEAQDSGFRLRATTILPAIFATYMRVRCPVSLQARIAALLNSRR